MVRLSLDPKNHLRMRKPRHFDLFLCNTRIIGFQDLPSCLNNVLDTTTSERESNGEYFERKTKYGQQFTVKCTEESIRINCITKARQTKFISSLSLNPRGNFFLFLI